MTGGIIRGWCGLPPNALWEAFADPDQITRFWLASSTGRLGPGATVHWAFKVAGAETDVEVVDPSGAVRRPPRFFRPPGSLGKKGTVDLRRVRGGSPGSGRW